jgi:septal ring factor EnvC (AmiA/AmiB activator)
MTDDIDLNFIAKQLERMLGAQAAFRDELLVTNARIGYVESSMERIEAGLLTLSLEVRAVRNQIARMNDRIVKLEDAPNA